MATIILALAVGRPKDVFRAHNNHENVIGVQWRLVLECNSYEMRDRDTETTRTEQPQGNSRG